ncbi:MAG: hypothetical protein JNJ54_05980 [Myxococcaceae bacterium]|nr:hypothetical protein [Myxococcaceae bacterium]
MKLDARGEAPVASPVAGDEAVASTPSAWEQYRLFAFPAVFGLMWLVSATGLGSFILRTFFGMWLHELGHATAAWLTGRWALPVPWFTFSFGRSLIVSALMFGGGAALARFGWQRRSQTTMGLGAVWLMASLVGHLAPTSFQEPFFTFAGDAGAMVFGALVSCGFLVRSPLRIFQGGLRWGWLVIGAASWADAFRVWWGSRTDADQIPFGIEDGWPSDPSRLVDEFGWDTRTMVQRFVAVGVLSLSGATAAFVSAVIREQLTRRRSA